ncbi:UDP-N-acetylmuramate dehydrogenase [Candidatus Nitrosacidococcus tergens]|uniref:UDP-N-acetylenolpyruvoylglucosamine reductase n=2 Tax=Candidatus Nitrosacidococcus tergens TaxID=553981 RepID=A0A7G1QB03_9GAMM|nr:UDP-N-acetylenolpyruvoylglucosamine reductase [Candidatus Nitrosacidococcus tergens]
MTSSILDISFLRGKLEQHVPMARYTSWRVGGPAKYLYKPKDREDLLAFLKILPKEEPLFWLGLGSNVLVRDCGLPSTVVTTVGTLNNIRRLNDTEIWVESGVTCAKLAKFCMKEGLCGAEFLAGIPGTIGGALTMNAGAFGYEIWELVTSVETVTIGGIIHQRSPKDYKISYRTVYKPKKEWFLAVKLKFVLGNSGKQRISTLLRQRNQTQPVHYPSAGSVFRNPINRKAGQLIELSQLKGTSMGNAQISEKHGNFIINKGGATAAHIEYLIQLIINVVSRKQGITLTPEVHIIGSSI